MSNELKHKSVGAELSQGEWEAIGAHIFDSQAIGDILYASSTTQLSRLAKGSNNDVLYLASGIPAWSATLAGLTLTTPIIATLYQDAGKTKLITFPAASDTLIGKATTDVLTNKTLTSPTINGTIATAGLTMPTFTLGGALNVNEKAIQDADGDTKIQLEESADEDIIRMDVGGTEAFHLTSVGILNLVKQSTARIYRTGSNMTLQPETYILPELTTESYDTQNELTIATVKSGAADATEASKLHDDDGGFAAGDVGKWVWNTTDHTYAKVTGFVDSGELDISADIMADTENYRIYDNHFTATEDGVYLVLAHFGVTNLQTLKKLRIRLVVNDAVTVFFDFFNKSAADLSTKGIYVQQVSLSASDKFQVALWCDDPNPINIFYGETGAYWQIIKLV